MAKLAQTKMTVLILGIVALGVLVFIFSAPVIQAF